MENATCKNDQLEVQIRSTRSARFKAGSDLSSKVNRVVVEVNEDSNEDQQITEISIKLFAEDCVKDQQD